MVCHHTVVVNEWHDVAWHFHCRILMWLYHIDSYYLLYELCLMKVYNVLFMECCWEKKTIVQWRDLLVDSSVIRGCYKNVSDGIGKTSIIRHLVLLLSLLCVLLLSHFVAGNKFHGWIFKFHSAFMIYCVHALFIACTCILFSRI